MEALPPEGTKKGISGTVPVALPPFGDPAPVKVSPRKPSPAPMPDPPALTFCEPLPAPGVPRFVAPGQAAYAGSGMSVPFPENTIPRRRARRNLIPGRIRAGNGVSRGISLRNQVWWAGLSGRGAKERRLQAPRATAAHNANVPEYHSRTHRRVSPRISRDEQASPVQSPPSRYTENKVLFSVPCVNARETFFSKVCFRRSGVPPRASQTSPHAINACVTEYRRASQETNKHLQFKDTPFKVH